MKLEKYVKYIRESRERGFEDYTIKSSLLMKGWPEVEIDKAFSYVNDQEIAKEIQQHDKDYPRQSFGSSITLYLEGELRAALEKRANNNGITLQEEIENLLKKSALNISPKKVRVKEKNVEKKLAKMGVSIQKHRKKKAKSKGKISKKKKVHHKKSVKRQNKKIKVKKRKVKRKK